MRMLAMILAAAGLLWTGTLVAAEGEAVHIHIIKLAQEPLLDGSADEWVDRAELWTEVLTTAPSFVSEPGDLAQSARWEPRPEVAVGVYADRLYMAVRWHDAREDSLYRPWTPRNGRYSRSRKRDDMLAVRFHTEGEFSACMLAGKDYAVDLWRWSAGRSQLSGHADDMRHLFSTRPVPQAAEYQTAYGILYIRKEMDVGAGGWANAPRPAAGTEVRLGVDGSVQPVGSRADVQAFGRWDQGVWTVELTRALDTGDPEDARFELGQAITGQLAFFDAGYQVQKQITPILVFDFH